MLQTPALADGGISQQLSSCTTFSKQPIYLGPKHKVEFGHKETIAHRETTTTNLWLLEEDKLSNIHMSSLLF